jgi:hypothetical protein
MADAVKGAMRQGLLQYATHLICEFPTNDMHHGQWREPSPRSRPT